MKFCKKCGKEMPDTANRCLECRRRIKTGGFIAGNNSDTDRLLTLPDIMGIAVIFSVWLIFITPIPLESIMILHGIAVMGIILGGMEYYRYGRTAGLALSIIGELMAIICTCIGILLIEKTPEAVELVLKYVEEKYAWTRDKIDIPKDLDSHCLFKLIRAIEQLWKNIQNSVGQPIVLK